MVGIVTAQLLLLIQFKMKSVWRVNFGAKCNSVSLQAMIETKVVLVRVSCQQPKKESTLAGLEPTRDKPNRFLVDRLNHSATVSHVGSVVAQTFLKQPLFRYRIQRPFFSLFSLFLPSTHACARQLALLLPSHLRNSFQNFWTMMMMWWFEKSTATSVIVPFKHEAHILCIHSALTVS